jgi:hypothetical protein
MKLNLLYPILPRVKMKINLLYPELLMELLHPSSPRFLVVVSQTEKHGAKEGEIGIGYTTI